MNEITKRKLNPTETIKQAIPRLIEAFVMFYGESERENITKKFNNMIAFGYATPDDMLRTISNDLEKKSDELIQIFLSNLKNSPDKQEEFKKTILGGFELEYLNLHPIHSYILYLGGNKNVKRDALKFVQNFFKDVNEENLDEYINNGNLDKLNEYANEYRKLIEQYGQYRDNFKAYFEYFKKCDNLKRELEEKYERKMLQEFSFLFTEQELKEIEQALNIPYRRIKDANKKAECYFDFNLSGQALIDAFSLESEQIINDESSWRRDSVINDRIKFFNNIGINLGTNYQDYLNIAGIPELIPKLQETAEVIIASRKKHYKEMTNEYYQMLDDYKEKMEMISQAGLANDTVNFNPSVYERGGTYVSDNVRKTDNGYESVPILCFAMAGITEYLDHMLIHELNHVYELSLQRVEGNKMYSIVGWDGVKGTIKKEVGEEQENDDEKKREYELFNEIINELIAQEITKILFDANGYIFNTSDNAKSRGGTSYEHTLFLVKSFYENYKQEIIESRRNGDMTKLFETVGRDNFENLNKLFHEFYENFAGFAYYNLMDSLQKNEDTEQTRKFYEIKSKRDKILLAMEEKSKNRTVATL